MMPRSTDKNHGTIIPEFSPDGRLLEWTERTTRLTRGNSYDEHPRYTLDGQVLWMTNADNPSHGTDWWTLGSDSSNPQQLSDFNAK
jgi:hypothetical protein